MMLQPYRPHDSDRIYSPPPLPARLLRRILVGGNHTIGEHVLVAGEHSGEMAEWLDELGFDVDAIDDSTERISASRHCGARFDIHFARLDGTDDLGDNPFDLIIADELNMHRDNLLGVPARLATAELLAQLKPRGELVIVREPGNRGHHDAACWIRHLACFPGELETFQYPTPLFSREMFQWIARGIRPEPFLTVALKTPLERLSLEQWCGHARRGVPTTSSCCATTTAAQRRDAA
jgi:hypothetical protein